MRVIKRSSIDDLYNDVLIENIVRSYGFELKKTGSNLKCKSPFTSEHTASFVVSPTKNIFKCFSTGKGGNAIKFIQEFEDCSWITAMEKAAKIMNFILEYEELDIDQKIKYQEEINSKKIVDIINDSYQSEFTKLTDDHWAKKMMKDRGYNDEVIKNFGIGYAPNSSAFISQKMISIGSLGLSNTLGYTKAANSVSYDHFRDRIMFPIHNYNGEVIAFGGRRSNEEKNFDENGKEKYSKYTNSVESELYKKEQVLYGFHLAKKSIRKEGFAILVEGYTDVISMHNAGIENTLATCGTALSNSQSRKIKSLCNEVVIFRDGDAPGIKAAIRDLEILLQNGFRVSVLIDDQGADPDDIVRREGKKVNDFIKYSKQDAIIWRAESLLESTISDQYFHQCENLLIQKTERIEKIKKQINPKISKNKKLISPDNKASSSLEKENKKLEKTLDDKIKSYEKEYDYELKQLVKYDSNAISEAIKAISTLIASVTDLIQRNDYVERIAKLFDLKEKDIKPYIDQALEAEKNGSKTEQSKKRGLKIGVPEGGDPDQFMADGFCEVGNTYHFQDQNAFFQGTNFKINPLFHIYGRNDNKRLCEVISEKGFKTLVDFDSKDFVNFGRLQETLIEEGNYFWYAGTSNIHFKLVTKKILDNFIMAHELKTLAVQREGFFAYADGVYAENEFKPVNQYGIIQLSNTDPETEVVESEYTKKITHYYSPAFSEIYKNIREDDDPYENDRFLVYKESPISLSVWMKSMIRVYGFEKASIGMAFIFSTLIRSYIVKQSEFPLLGLFGEKGSGKSQFGSALSSFYFHMMPAFDLNNGTMVGFYRRLARTRDTIAYLEEYSDNIKFEMGQAMKNSFDNRGREKGSMTADNRTSISKVNTSIIYAGQYLPGFDEGSLAERTLILYFQKKEANEYSEDDLTEFSRLKNWQEKGLNSLLLEIYKYRQDLIQNFHTKSNEIQRAFKADLKNIEHSERMMKNYATILAPIKILEDLIDLPFTYDEFYELCKNEVIENSDLVTDIGGMSEFWKIIDVLCKDGYLVKDKDYVVERVRTVKGKKRVAGAMVDDVFENKNSDPILFIDFNKFYQEYQKAVNSRPGSEVIGSTTLVNYFKSKKYFIKSSVTKRFGGRPQSCYTFNYEMMRNSNLLNILEQTATSEEVDYEASNAIVESETNQYNISTTPTTDKPLI